MGVGDDHFAVGTQGEVVRVLEQSGACRAPVARVALGAGAGDRAHDPVRVDEADPVVVLGDDDALVVVDLEPADSAERRGGRGPTVSSVAALPGPGDNGLPPAGDAVDPIARCDVEPGHVVVRKADDVAQAGDRDPPLARPEVDAHDAIQLPVGDEQVAAAVVERERPGLQDLDGARLALRLGRGDARQDRQQKSQRKGS